MLDPSSSEEESDGIVEEESREVMAPQSGATRISPSRTSESTDRLQPTSRGSSARPSSPSPSAASEQDKEDVEKLQREEEERKKKLQLYVFVMRCVAYPFNAKQPTDMARRQLKVRARGVRVSPWEKRYASQCSFYGMPLSINIALNPLNMSGDITLKVREHL